MFTTYVPTLFTAILDILIYVYTYNMSIKYLKCMSVLLGITWVHLSYYYDECDV